MVILTMVATLPLRHLARRFVLAQSLSKFLVRQDPRVFTKRAMVRIPIHPFFCNTLGLYLVIIGVGVISIPFGFLVHALLGGDGSPIKCRSLEED